MSYVRLQFSLLLEENSLMQNALHGAKGIKRSGVFHTVIH